MDEYISTRIVTVSDFEHFCEEERIPLLYFQDDPVQPGTFVCFERDYEKIHRIIPVFCILETIPNQIENTQERLRITYEKDIRNKS